MDPTDPRKNLRPPIKPGEVRNPMGKNGSSWLKEFRDYFEEEVPVRRKGKGMVGVPRYRRILEAAYKRAMHGSDQTIKTIFEQLNGKPRQHVTIDGQLSNGPPVEFMLPPNGRDVSPEDAEHTAESATAPSDDSAIDPDDGSDDPA